jgi:hypothetical protein
MLRQFCFSKFVCFFPWLAGRFHNFELTQNKWPYIIAFREEAFDSEITVTTNCCNGSFIDLF